MAQMTITAQDITRRSGGRWMTGDRPSPGETVGYVAAIADGVARVKGLPQAMSSELLEFEGGLLGVVLDLEEDSIGVVMMGDSNHVEEGDPVRQTSRVLEIGVGDELLGRVIDTLGNPIDGRGPINTTARRAWRSRRPPWWSANRCTSRSRPGSRRSTP